VKSPIAALTATVYYIPRDRSEVVEVRDTVVYADINVAIDTLIERYESIRGGEVIEIVATDATTLYASSRY
jgi:hypothetical protein